jgi:hypothetical protein
LTASRSATGEQIARAIRAVPADASCLVALAVLSYALNRAFGLYDRWSVALVLLGVFFCAIGYFGSPRPAHWLVWAACGAVIAAQVIYQGFLFPVVASASPATAHHYLSLLAVLLVGVSIVAALTAARHQVLFWLSAAVGVGAEIWALVRLWKWQVSDIDVLPIVQAASGALLKGMNPYLLATATYTPGGVIQAHFPYGPGVILMAIPGRIMGDARVSSAILFVVFFAAVLGIAWERGRSQVRLVAGICIAFPLTLGMILSSWADIYTVAPFAAWAALRRREPPLAIGFLALSFATKPTFFLMLVPALLWSHRIRIEAGLAAIGAAVVIAPFAIITGVGQFFYDIAGIQILGYTTRPDALTLNALLLSLGHSSLPLWAGFFVAGAVSIAVLWRRPRDYGDAFLAAAAISAIAFLVSKNAFFNYYFVPAALMLMALAGRGVPLELDGKLVRLPFSGRLDRFLPASLRATQS